MLPRLILGVLGVVLVTACAGDDKPNADGRSSTTAEAGTVATTTSTTSSTADETGPIVWAHSDTSDPALELFSLGGTLTYDPATRCLSIMRFDLYPVVWPKGTVALEGEVGVVLPDGTVARPGDGVTGDGAYETTEFDASSFDNPPDEYATSSFNIPPECMGPSGQVMSFNRDATMQVQVFHP